jgi:hypothetical protein
MQGDNGKLARILESWLAHTTSEVLADSQLTLLLDPIFHGDRRLRFFLGPDRSLSACPIGYGSLSPPTSTAPMQTPGPACSSIVYPCHLWDSTT